MGWTGLLFPNPETSYQSTLADQNNNNNITGIKSKRIDELLDQYDKEFSQEKRVPMIREVDGILANSHEYILEWEAPFQRIAFWNKFGVADGILTRIGDYRDLPSLWWVDPQKQADLNKALADPSIKLPVGPLE